jgi:hypothetical protein
MKRNRRPMSAGTAERLRNARAALSFAAAAIHGMPEDCHPALFDTIADAYRAIVAELSIANHFITHKVTT